ncbi:hypothetical protein MMC08_000062 [Hypocenomyce scalaris]|nr:hypothetical protein [Hypocenomyce scalaris]
MDTTAYLTRQGWLGAGHSLHPGGRGIKKPLLVSKKPNVLGLGKRQHNSHAEQWWARAFDSSLKNLAVDQDRATGVHHVTVGGSGALEMVQNGGGKWVGKAGLYGHFVRGEGLSGTLTPEDRGTEAMKAVEGKLIGAKRNSQDDVDDTETPKKRRKAHKVVNVPGCTMDAEGLGDKVAVTMREPRFSKEERRTVRREERNAVKSGEIQSAATAGGSIATPTEATTKQKRRQPGEVAEKRREPPRGDGRAVADGGQEMGTPTSPALQKANPSALEKKLEKKRRKAERKASKCSPESEETPKPSDLKVTGKGKRKRKRKDQEGVGTFIYR